MSVGKRIIRNVFSNWCTYFINIVIAFFLAPFVVHTLGNTGYGVWILVGSLTGYLGLLDLGIRPAIVRYVSKYKALNDEESINQVINTSLVIFTLAGLLALLISLILAHFSVDIFKVTKDYHRELRLVLVLVGLNVALGFPFGVFNAFLNAWQRFDLNNAIIISAYLLRAGLIVLFLKLGYGLLALALITLATSLVEYVLKVRCCFKVFPALKIKLSLANKKTLKMIFQFSLFSFIMGISTLLAYYSDSIVIGYFLSAATITFFAIAANLIEYLKQLVNTVSVTLTPVASTFDALGDLSRMKDLLLVGTKYLLIIILPIGYTFIIMGKTFINLWMGESYGPTSSTVLLILTFSYFGFLSQFISTSIFYGMSKHRLLSLSCLGMSILNLVLSIILVKPWGIYGVALGTAIPLVFYGTFFVPTYICRVLKLKPWIYVKRSFIPPFFASLPFLLLIFYFENNLRILTLTQFFKLVGLACMVYSICAFFICLEPPIKRVVLEKCKITYQSLMRLERITFRNIRNKGL
jgi:O-antigen/teichoic acid export membrane protein